MQDVKLLPAGEQGLVVEFGTEINENINIKVHRLAKKLSEKASEAILEVVPTYRSLLIYFDPLKTSRNKLGELVKQLIADNGQSAMALGQHAAKIVHIPVCYGGDFGPDLKFVAEYNHLDVEEVVKIHTATPYLVYMLGFTPGFPYLGGMSEKIATPRLEKPRVCIPAGSVGIAGSQTGFYPVESPGGWRLIGRTPVKAFNPDSANPFLFAAGDYLQFKAVSIDEYVEISCQVEAGTYTPTITYLEKGGQS